MQPVIGGVVGDRRGGLARNPFGSGQFANLVPEAEKVLGHIDPGVIQPLGLQPVHHSKHDRGQTLRIHTARNLAGRLKGADGIGAPRTKNLVPLLEVCMGGMLR